MFGPRDSKPIPLKTARTCDLVFEGGKPFLVVSHATGWEKYEMNDDQLWNLFNRMAPKLRGR